MYNIHIHKHIEDTQLATSALIGYQNKNGVIITSYVSSDGYLSWTGQKLQDYYNSSNLASSLVLGGDIFQVRDDINEIWRLTEPMLSKTRYSSLGEFLKDKAPNGKHKGVYLNGFLHVYLFMNNTWYYHKDNQLHLLKDFVNASETTTSLVDKLADWVWKLRFNIARFLEGVAWLVKHY